MASSKMNDQTGGTVGATGCPGGAGTKSVALTAAEDKLGDELAADIRTQATKCSSKPPPKLVNDLIKLIGSEHGFSYKPVGEPKGSVSVVKKTQKSSKNRSGGELYIQGGEGGTGRTSTLCDVVAGLGSGRTSGANEKRKPDPNSKPTSYHKRTVGEVDEARKEFDGVKGNRAEFMKAYGEKLKKDKEGDVKNPALKDFDDDDIELMIESGKVPPGYNVHHKTPIFRSPVLKPPPPPPPEGYPNHADNLELLPNDFHKEYNKELHWYEDGDNLYENGKGPSIGSLKV